MARPPHTSSTTTPNGGATPALTPRLRFPEFRQQPSWTTSPLGDSGEFLSSLSGKTAEHFGSGSARYITYMNVFTNTFTDMSSLGIVDVRIGESQNAIKRGDVLFTVSSETPEEVGMSSVVLEDVPNCYLNSFCTLFRFAPSNRPDSRFVGYSLRQPVVREHLAKRAQGSTRFNLSKEAFRSVPLVLPGAGEQQKVADCLTSLDKAIAAQGWKVEALKHHKKGLMQHLFPQEGQTLPRLRFPEFRGGPEWASDRFSALYVFQRNNTLSRDQLNYEDGPAKNVHYGDIHTKFPTHFDITRENVPFVNQGMPMPPEGSDDYCVEGDLILADASEDTNDVGKCIEVVKLNGERLLAGQHTILARRRDQRLVVGFGGYLLRSKQIRAQIEKEAQGTKVYAISSTRLGGIGVSFPSVPAEQQRITDCLGSLDAAIAGEAAALAALKAHKKGLMQGLFPQGRAIKP